MEGFARLRAIHPPTNDVEETTNDVRERSGIGVTTQHRIFVRLVGTQYPLHGRHPIMSRQTTAPLPHAATKGKPRKPTARTKAAMELLRKTGTTKMSEVELTVALFAFPGILSLAKVYDDFRRTQLAACGRKNLFPTAALVAVLAAARVTGSIASAVTLLEDVDVWRRCCEAWDTFADVEPLPPYPPLRHHIEALRDTIDQRDGLIDDLKVEFTAMSLRQARAFGHLLPGRPVVCSGQAEHTIFGDGTILKPATDVIAHTNPVTGETFYPGSRATDPSRAKVQREVRRLDTDHGGQQGINFITLHTETTFGVITLGVESTLDAEQWAALAILQRLAATADDGIHTLVYDGAINGWLVDAILGTHGIETLQKGRNRSDRNSPDTDADSESLDRAIPGWKPLEDDIRPFDVEGIVAARTADFLDAQASKPSTQTKGRASLTKPSLAYVDAVRRHMRHDLLSRYWYSGAPLPVGTSLYPTARDDSGFETVRSEYLFLAIEHAVADGTLCTHDLAIDDGALFTVALDEATGDPVKTAYLASEAAERARTAHGYTLTRSYVIPCVHGDFTWKHTWAPQTPWYSRGEKPKGTPKFDRVGRYLRTAPRADTERFEQVLRLRNYSESFNKWVKAALPNHGRAASLSRRKQELDFLMSGLVMNATTWHNRALEQGQQ